jgi:hypothetical protein
MGFKYDYHIVAFALYKCQLQMQVEGSTAIQKHSITRQMQRQMRVTLR